MKFVNLKTEYGKEKIISLMADHERVNEGVKFDEKRGRPIIKMKRKLDRITLKCEMVGGASKDNGFLVGTYFIGKISEKDGVTSIRGVVTTAPIYHLMLLALSVFYVYRCIALGGFNPVPPILIIFSIVLFSGEFKKQGIISRYLSRVIRRAPDLLK